MVSIIIPCYNYEQYLGECLKSCCGQTYKDIEIMVVDDASMDGSRDIIEEYQKKDPRVKFYFNPTNQGYSNAKNNGIIFTEGTYIVHLDADDMLTPNSVEVRLREMVANESLDMVHGAALRVYDNVTWEWACANMKTLGKRVIKDIVHAQGVMIKRAVYAKFGLYYEQLRSKADKEMWYRLGIHRDTDLPKLIKSKQIKNDVAFYRKHDLQMHKLRKENHDYEEQIEMIFNNRMKQLKKYGITPENTLFQAGMNLV